MSVSSTMKFKTIVEFLESVKITDKADKNITHTSMGEKSLDIYPAKYRIEKEKLETFYKLYTKWIFNYEEELNITEAHNPELCCVLIDLDFRWNTSDGEQRKYTPENIIFLLDKYMFYLNKYLKMNDDQKQAFILEKEKAKVDPKKPEVMKDGIHIMLPFLVARYDVLHLVREEIVKDSEVEEYFKNLGFTNPIDDIVDKSVIQRNNWFMYGSSKPGKEAYKITQIIDMNSGVDIYSKKKYKNSELVKLLSISNEENLKNPCEIVDEEMFKEQYELRFGKPKKRNTNKAVINKTTENLDKIRQLVSILNPRRADSFDSWIRLGWCLHNIDYNLLDAWKDFSMNSSKYEEGICEEKWDAMVNKGLSLGSLYRWAKEDNLAEFKKIVSSSLQNFILSSMNKSHHDIAKVVYEMFKHEFKCVSNKNKTWYQFANHRWNEIDNAVELKKKISEEVVNEYCNYAHGLDPKIKELSGDPGQQELYIKRAQTALSISLQLRNEPFKNHIINACSVLFHDKEFYEKLDSNVNLLGFDNGVYDLEKMEFREGLPEDYMAFSTGIDYKEHDDDDELVNNVHEFLSQVLPIPAVKQYVLQVMSSMLSGKTGDEKFHIWTGCGGNGKSKLIELFENAFGDYCGNMSVTLITQKRPASNACTPELLKNKGKRFITLQEPDEDEKIHVGAMKELSGGDKIQARGLHKDPIEFKPQWKIVMTSNVLPEVSANDRGTWRRIRVTEFISRFVDPEDLDADIPYQFPIDYDLSTKLKEWPEAFMSILIKEYAKYKITGLVEPEEVKVNTKAYKQESDIFMQFMNETIEKDVGSQIMVDDGYFMFREWYKTSGSTAKIPQKKDFIKNMNSKYGKVNSKNIWKGIKFVKKGDDEEEDD
jgi:P4 family phage/plasmid primase-like protien